LTSLISAVLVFNGLYRYVGIFSTVGQIEGLRVPWASQAGWRALHADSVDGKDCRKHGAAGQSSHYKCGRTWLRKGAFCIEATVVQAGHVSRTCNAIIADGHTTSPGGRQASRRLHRRPKQTAWVARRTKDERKAKDSTAGCKRSNGDAPRARASVARRTRCVRGSGCD
jgi:hypothetical protein